MYQRSTVLTETSCSTVLTSSGSSTGSTPINHLTADFNNLVDRSQGDFTRLPFFGGLGALLGIIGVVLCGMVTMEFVHTGMVARFPTLIGAVMLVIAGLLLAVTGIILDVIAKNDRKTFITDTNRFAYLRRH